MQRPDTIGLTSMVLCCAALGAAAAVPVDAQRFEAYLPHPSGIELSSSKSGVVCLEDNEPSYVCQGAYTVQIVGDAMCAWSDEIDYPCTWYGYQFDLRNVGSDTQIVCDVTNSIPTTFGPKTDKVTGRFTAQYVIELTAGQEHLFHPAYHTYAPVQEETTVISVHACSVDGVPLYRASFRAYYEPE